MHKQLITILRESYCDSDGKLTDVGIHRLEYLIDLDAQIESCRHEEEELTDKMAEKMIQ